MTVGQCELRSKFRFREILYPFLVEVCCPLNKAYTPSPQQQTFNDKDTDKLDICKNTISVHASYLEEKNDNYVRSE